MKADQTHAGRTRAVIRKFIGGVVRAAYPRRYALFQLEIINFLL
jgi:hypothetical protein